MTIFLILNKNSPWSLDFVENLLYYKVKLHIFFVNLNSTSNIGNDDQRLEDLKNQLESSVEINLPHLYLFEYLYLTYRVYTYSKKIYFDHLITLYCGGFGLAAYLSCVRPYSIYAVGSDILISNYFKKKLNKVILQSASHVFCNGDELQKKCHNISKNPNTINLLLGIDTQLFQPKQKTSKATVFLCNRKFEPIYNNRQIIDALLLLSEQNLDFQFIFSSNGKILDLEKSYFFSRACNKLRKSVTFLGGVSKKHMMSLLAKSDIYISMSISDGTPISLLEAMACGLYPIVSDITAIKDWVQDTNGSVVKLTDAEDLAKKMQYHIVNRQCSQQFITNNRKLVKDHADSKTNIVELIKILSNK